MSQKNQTLHLKLIPRGFVISPVEVRRTATGSNFTLFGLAGVPAVLLFVSSACGKCQSVLHDVDRILTPASNAGLCVWIVPVGGDEAAWERSSYKNLSDRMITLSTDTIQLLNPQRAVPSYIFINHASVVESSGPVGSDDWIAFIRQMHDE